MKSSASAFSMLSLCIMTLAFGSCNSRIMSHGGSSASDGGPVNEIDSVLQLAKAFKSLLTSDQQKVLQLGWSKADAAKWSNFPQGFSHPQRVGIGFSQLNEAQITAAKKLMAYVLDNKIANEGFDESEGIQAADNIIGALPGKSSMFGSGNYYIAFLGEPSATELWELQFGGHHLAFSNTYKNGKLIGMTPSFRGVEPMNTFETNGKHYLPMEQERVAFKNILDKLSDNELAAAKLSSTFADILLGPGKDNAFPSTRQGLKIGTLSKEKQDLVMHAITLYVKDLNSAETNKILQQYKNELAETFVSYSGDRKFEAVGDYIRIDGPGVWIEYNLQPSRDIKTPPTHPHSIWRDRKTDYGGQ